MEISRRILLYGNSVILGTLGASLRRHSQFEVITVIPPLRPDQKPEIPEADVILFDLEAPRPQAAFSLLESCPKLLLIGVSPDTNLVKMWAGQQLQQLSTQGLLEVINEQLKNLPAESGSSDQSVHSKY